MTYQEFLKNSIKVCEENFARYKTQRPRPRGAMYHTQGVLAGYKTALRIAEHNKIDGEVATSVQNPSQVGTDQAGNQRISAPEAQDL